MNICVAGTSGYIGGSVAMVSLAAGHRERGLSRSPSEAERLASRGVEPVLGSMDDADVLTRKARATDGVINAASVDHVEGSDVDGRHRRPAARAHLTLASMNLKLHRVQAVVGQNAERESNEALPNLEFSLKQQAKSQTTVLQTEAKNRQALPS